MMHVFPRTLFGVALLMGMLTAYADKDDDDDKAPTGAQADALPSLTAGQQHAVGIVVARAAKSSAPQRTAAFGQILDAATLVADVGEVEASAAAARASAAEAARLQGLYAAGASASQKALQAAEADQVRTHAQADAAAARFALHWPALAAQPPATRRPLLDAVAKGQLLLARAELPGRNLLGSLPARALLDVDGVSVPARVLGAMPATGTEAAAAGVLLEIDNPPAGLGVGARVAVTLSGAALSGLLLPRTALLYDENGAYVFKQLKSAQGDTKTHYAPVKVKLLLAQGDAWLVDGIDDDDDIVVRGAGVLWSLQGISGRQADDDNDD